MHMLVSSKLWDAGFCGLPVFTQQFIQPLKKENCSLLIAPCSVFHFNIRLPILYSVHMSQMEEQMATASRSVYIHTSYSLIYPDKSGSIGFYHNPLGLGKLPHTRKTCI